MRGTIFSALPAVLSLALLGGTPGCTTGTETVIVADPVDESTLNVVNSSDFALVELYIVDVGSSTWGANLLSGDVLLPGEDVLLTGIACDTHDAMVVAEDGVTCELRAIDLCFDDATWVIGNNTCDAFLKAAQAKISKAAKAN